MRVTTDYQILVPSEGGLAVSNAVLDELIERATGLGIEFGTTSAYPHAASARFRIKTSDAEALRLAAQIADGREFTVHTGYGTHRRQVTEA